MGDLLHLRATDTGLRPLPDRTTAEAERQNAAENQQAIYGARIDVLDPSFAEKVGIGAPSQPSRLVASSTDSSLQSQDLSTSRAIGAEPSSGTQALSSDQSLARSPDRAQNAPLLSSKNRSDMGTVLSSADTSNMGVGGAEVNSARPLLPDLPERNALVEEGRAFLRRVQHG
jgi:hypothetical protein